MSSQESDNLPAAVDPRVRRFSGYTVHGDLPFSAPFISCVLNDGPGGKRLYQGGVENGLVLPGSILHVVSLYQHERYTVGHELLTNLKVRADDAVSQPMDIIDPVAAYIAALYDSGEPGDILVHCQAGLNRSGVVVARVLQKLGWDTSEAIDHLREVRSPAVLCNPAFEAWLRGN